MNRLGAGALVGVLLISTSLPALADDPATAGKTDATPAAEPEPPAIEFHGQVGTGFRLFVDKPASQRRAKFEQYGSVPSGIFVDYAYLQAVTKGGFVADVWGTHAGQNNQNYVLQLSQPGSVYLTFEWDQTPHLNSTKALTLYDTSNPANLTIPDSVQAALQSGSDQAHKAVINANVHPLTLNIDRDTAKASIRYTPSPSWNIRVDYSHEDRSGNQSFGTPINEFNAQELPAPVAYTTQNFSTSVEYAGKWQDDRKFSLSAAYAGSIFENKYSSFTWDNPFRVDPPGSNAANQGRNALAPDNTSGRLTLTGAIDLPFSTRYMATYARSSMRQNDAFIPFTINPSIKASGGIPMTSLSLLPALSLNGRMDETLINNVLTTRFSDDLTGTLKVRKLSLDNKTPRLVFNEWVQWDGEKADEARANTRPAYDRTNTSYDLSYRFLPGWKAGAVLGLENFNRRESDVRKTDEVSGKLFVDVSPADLGWLKVRASVLKAQRHFDRYDALNNVGVIGHPPDGKDYPASAAMRKYDLAERSRLKADMSVEMSFDSGWTITPTVGWRNDEFSDGQVRSGLLGLKREGYWSAGLEQSIPVTDSITLMASYMRENYDRRMIDGKADGGGAALVNGRGNSNSGSGSSGSGGGGGGGDLWGSRIHDLVDTFEGSLTYALGDAILPGNMDLQLGYVYSHSNNKTDTYALNGGGNLDQFPDVTNDFQRLDASVKYDIDPEFVAAMGWDGEASVKLRFLHERNRMTNWQIDNIVPYMVDVDPEADKSLFLAALNPNYAASAVTLEFGFSW